MKTSSGNDAEVTQDEMYTNLKDMLKVFDCKTPWHLGRALYTYNSCGPWIVFLMPESSGIANIYYEDEIAHKWEHEQTWWDQCSGVRIGSIVEGSSAEVDPIELLFPFEYGSFDDAMEHINDEADFYWQRDREEAERGEEDVQQD